MHDRHLKRAWLRLVGAVDDDGPSGSVPKALTPALVDSTLGSIQGDDVWVALACLDAVESNAEVTLDVALTSHMLETGLQRTKMSEVFDLQSKQVRYKLAIRKMLLKYKRMLYVWEQVYGADAGKNSFGQSNSTGNDSLHNEQDDGEELDAWEEVTGVQPKPLSYPSTSISLSQFFQESPLHHIMKLASSRQTTTLIKYLQALPKSMFSIVHPRRLDIIKELLLSSASANDDLSQMLQCRLLPGVSKGKESDIWTDCSQKAQDIDDVTDGKEVCDALALHHLIRLEEPQHQSGSGQIMADDILLPESLISFYSSCIDALEQQSACNSGSIQLANIVLSQELSLPADAGFSRLAEDLRLLHPLVRGSSSCHSCSSWTLSRFRDELNARPELSQKQAMAVLYLEEAKSESDAVIAAREGAVPYLRSISQRSNVHGDDSDRSIEGFLHTMLALADKDRISIVTFLLNSSTQYGIDMDAKEKSKVALACLLGASRANGTIQHELDRLAASALTTLESIPRTGQETILRESVGAALNQRAGHELPPSQLYRFFARLELPALRCHIEQCRRYLALCQHLAEWNSALNVSWLFNAQGQHEEQVSCLNRIVRSFAREHKSQQQWASLTKELTASVGKSECFDTLDEIDVAVLVVEGALRTGDVRVYSYILKEHTNRLSDAKQEDLIVSASREFYDNATSTNVHQGDMKTAHEILTQCGYHKSTRIEQEKAFIEATSRLCSFRIQSLLRPGIALAPIEIRLSSDRIDFIKRLLETNQDAYKSPDLILELAQKLCADPNQSEGSRVPDRPLVEGRTLALLTEAALGQADYAHAQSSCQRLVANVGKLEKRVDQSAASHGHQHHHLQEVLVQVRESAYRSCFLLSNQHEWKDYGSRLTWCSYVLAYCPNEHIERYLKTWRQLEEAFQQDLIDNPPKDWDQVAIQLKSGQGGLASSLASIGGLGAFESLSPFSTLFASTRNTSSALSRGANQDDSKQASSRHTRDDSLPPRVNSPSSRAARLFDSLGGNSSSASSGDGTYLDPAERAARAARRFFGGFA